MAVRPQRTSLGGEKLLRDDFADHAGGGVVDVRPYLRGEGALLVTDTRRHSRPAYTAVHPGALQRSAGDADHQHALAEFLVWRSDWRAEFSDAGALVVEIPVTA